MDELREVIAMLKWPEFKPEPHEIDDDLHQRIANAVHNKYIKQFNMRESSRDGDQDLTMFMREVEDVVREIMEDSRFNGHQHYKFEAEFDENGELLFGGGRQVQVFPFRLDRSGISCVYTSNMKYIPCIYFTFYKFLYTYTYMC